MMGRKAIAPLRSARVHETLAIATLFPHAYLDARPSFIQPPTLISSTLVCILGHQLASDTNCSICSRSEVIWETIWSSLRGIGGNGATDPTSSAKAS